MAWIFYTTNHNQLSLLWFLYPIIGRLILTYNHVELHWPFVSAQFRHPWSSDRSTDSSELSMARLQGFTVCAAAAIVHHGSRGVLLTLTLGHCYGLLGKVRDGQ